MASANGAEIARAYVLVVPSTQGAQKELTRELVPEAEAASREAGTKGGAAFKSALTTAAKAAAAAMAAAVGASIALIKSSLDAYAETEQLQGGIAKLFGTDAAETVLANAAEAYKTAGMSANDYMQQVTGISAALLKSGISAEEAAVKADEAMRQIADNANTFGRMSAEELGNVYSALARGSFQVLDQLSLGYGGTKTGMQQLIADANAYAKATGRAADLSIDSFADIVTAIGLVQEAQGIAGTTATEAEQTISGSLSMLGASWKNFVAGLGDPNADLDRLIDNVLSSLDSAASNIIPTVDRIAKSLIKALPDMVKKVADWLPTALPTVLEALVTLATSVAEQLPGIIETLVNVLTDNAEMIIGAAITIAMALVLAVPRIVNALLPLIPKAIEGLLNPETGLLSPENIMALVDGFIATVEAVVTHLPEIISALIDAIPRVIEGLLNPETGLLAPQNINKMVEGGKRLGEAIVNGIIDIVSTSGPAIIGSLGSGIGFIASALSGTPSFMGGGSSTTNIYTGNVAVTANNAASFASSLRAAASMGY